MHIFAGINKVKVNVQGAGLFFACDSYGDFVPSVGIFTSQLSKVQQVQFNFIYLFFTLKEHPASISTSWNL